MEESKLGEFINEDQEILWAITVIETAREKRLRKCPAAAVPERPRGGAAWGHSVLAWTRSCLGETLRGACG